MSELELYGIQKIQFGIDSINHITNTILPYGNRVLLVSEGGGKDKDNFNRVQGFLRAGGIEPLVFNDIRPGVKTSIIQTIADIGAAGKVQVVVGLGGMRVLSLARVAAMLIGSGTDLNDILQGSQPDSSDCHYIEVPNSCRNHFMLKNSCVISDTVSEVARLIPLPANLTRAVILDPQLSMSLSKKYQLVAILDTLLASVEGYLSRKKNFLSDIHHLEGIQRLQRAMFQTLRRPDDSDVRILASEGGLLSAMGLASSGQGIGGTLSYMINARFQVPKSWIAMVILPHILDLYAEREPQRVTRIADALGEDVSGIQSEQASTFAAAATRRYLAQLELPMRLRDFNLSMDELMQICGPAAQFPLNDNCGLELDQDEVCNLVKKAF